ncbi:DNA starvation/stationary phase protection protein [Bacterioplanes sanyensis]|uniref:DNA starvation/stationary phase protection protein n=1 Tax=Bacterioplanes sanyensis TaxID=1249553 RepID=A0A222FH43_9GAMM|nr:Dps family protein [Bacterioplanes sanyensis]ASP37804.1 DNA starvation/stationary phase protection protein [Bacterioplanes sanyensis]
MSKTFIGLKQDDVQALAQQLNELLANYQILYMNVRGFHWNIKGENFFELHVKFEELYNDLLLKVDEVAERILTLGHQPLHAFSDYIELSSIAERKQVSDGREAVESIVDGLAQLVARQRTVLAAASDADDEGTAALMSDYISQQEKSLWMYRAYLGH